MPAKKVTTKAAAKEPTAKNAVKKAASQPIEKASAAKKAPAKKAAEKPAAKASSTTIIVNYDAGMGNSIVLRGDGPGLTWDTGTIMENIDAETWKWTTSKAKKDFEVKFLINDTTWAQGENALIKPGTTSGFSPVF